MNKIVCTESEPSELARYRQVVELLAGMADEVSIVSPADAAPGYTRDWTDQYGEPAPVVRPRTPEALAEVMRRLHLHGIPVVAQGGRTGLVAGAVPLAGEVVVSCELLRAIEACDLYGGTMTVQAGVSLQTVQDEAARHGLFYPVDLGARGTCTIGGTIATNAGGNRVLQYGMTRASVLGLEAVLPDGTIVSRLNPVIKDNAGYDLKQIFVGSEGTLGIVTRAVLRLLPLPLERVTVAIGLESLTQVLDALVACRLALGPGLTSFEVMWRDFHEHVTRQLAIGRDPFGGEAEFLVLIEISLFGNDADVERQRALDIMVDLAERIATDQIVVAKSASEASELWRIREASGEVAHSVGNCIPFDVSIPTAHLVEALGRIEQQLASIDPSLKQFRYGHLGDGNLHLMVVCDERVAAEVDAAVYETVTAFRGSLSAEHGIGLAKRQALARYSSPPEIAMMQKIKKAIDPLNLLNRDRVFVM